MKSILDPSFKYTPAVSTDIRKTFERVRREQAKRKIADAASAKRSVIPMHKAG